MAQRRRKPKKALSLPRGAAAVVLAALALAALIWLLLPGEEEAPVDSHLPKNPYSAEDFAWQDGFLTCTAGETKLGIDVSSHQGKIDWQQVADAGVEFAFIRIGYRGYTRGGINTDELAAENIRQAQAAGIPVGVYFYSQAVNRQEAAEEAQFCIDFLRNHELQLPVVFDWEYVSDSARTGSVGRATLTACAQVFCDAVRDAGYEPMVYFNPSVASSLLDLGQLTDYGWWLAWYNQDMNYPYRVDFWQYTENGNVPGITGDVDIDLWFIYD